MNIFILDQDPKKIAEYHADRHVVKMPIECTQMVCTTLRERCGIDYGYKSVYVNHPCTRWVGETFENLLWTVQLGIYLCEEYTHRFGKYHKTMDVLQGLKPFLEPAQERLPGSDGPTPFYKAVSRNFKDFDPVTAYRLYYISVKRRLHVWTKRDVPFWLREGKEYERLSQILCRLDQGD